MKAAGPVSKADRRLANRINADKRPLEQVAAVDALRWTRRIVRDVVGAAKRGDDVERALEAAIYSRKETLTALMVAAHALGVRRTQLQFPQRVLGLSDTYKGGAEDYLARQKLLTPADRAELVAYYGPAAERVLGGMYDAQNTAARAAILDAAQVGMHRRQGVEAVKDALAAAGLAPQNSFTCEAIFRTQTHSAYSAGRWQVAQDPDIGEILWGYKYLTVGDDRVRPDHVGFEGSRLPKNDPFWSYAWPPNGWACRCVTIEILADSDEASTIEPHMGQIVDGKPTPPAIPSAFMVNPGQVATGDYVPTIRRTKYRKHRKPVATGKPQPKPKTKPKTKAKAAKAAATTRAAGPARGYTVRKGHAKVGDVEAATGHKTMDDVAALPARKKLEEAGIRIEYLPSTDPDVAAAVEAVIAEHIAKYPALATYMEMVGTQQTIAIQHILNYHETAVARLALISPPGTPEYARRLAILEAERDRQIAKAQAKFVDDAFASATPTKGVRGVMVGDVMGDSKSVWNAEKASSHASGWSVSKNMEGSVTHEMGHVIEYRLMVVDPDTGDILDPVIKSALAPGAETEAMFYFKNVSDYPAAVASKAETAVQQAAGGGGVAGKRARKLTIKARREAIAELWTEYVTHPNPRPLAIKVGKRLETLLAKAAK